MPNRNLIVRPRHMPDVIEKPWAIVSLGAEGFHVREILKENDFYIFYKFKDEEFSLSKQAIVARFGTAQMATTQCGKAKALEKQLRPMWQAAIEHLKRVEQLMLEQVYACARGGIG